MPLIRITHLHETILSIAPDGMVYLSADNQAVYITFEACYQNYLQKYPHYLKYPNLKKIGERDSTYLMVELATDPITRFEFDNPDDWGHFLVRLRRCGWLTFDLS